MTIPFDPKPVFHYGMSTKDMDASIAAWKQMGAEVLMPPSEAEGVDVLCFILLFNDTVLELVAPTTDEARDRMEPTCHGINGDIPARSGHPSLLKNETVRDHAPDNLVQIIANGVDPHGMTGRVLIAWA